jgi:hypothetical protein
MADTRIKNPIDVFMIWGAERDAIDVPYLVDAWSEWQLDDNLDGWNEAIATAEKENEMVRIIVTTVDYLTVIKAFSPVVIGNSGTQVGKG